MTILTGWKHPGGIARPGFLVMVFTSGLPTPSYCYTFIPILAISVLMLIDREELGLAVKRFWPWASNQLASRLSV